MQTSLVLAGSHWTEQQLCEDPKGTTVPLGIKYFCDGLHRLSRENAIGPLLSPISARVSMEETFLPLQLVSYNFQDANPDSVLSFWSLFLFIISEALLFVSCQELIV